jgi:hypothetical protein
MKMGLWERVKEKFRPKSRDEESWEAAMEIRRLASRLHADDAHKIKTYLYLYSRWISRDER